MTPETIPAHTLSVTPVLGDKMTYLAGRGSSQSRGSHQMDGGIWGWD